MDRRDLKVIFMGTPEFAGTNLKALIDAGFDVRLVLCQPDKPVGRKHILTAPPVKVMAQENNIAIFFTKAKHKSIRYVRMLLKGV